MGQTIGRAPLRPIATHFVNLPCRSMHQLWDAFNDIAEGFGLTYEEMNEMVRVVLKDFLGYTEKKLDGLCRELFQTFDDDHNDLADALEFLSALAVVSGMSRVQKMGFVFAVYDFDESGRLTVDEMILALRSTLSGLCKLSGVDMPPETHVERVAVGAFENAKSIDGSTITKDDFARYCAATPEIESWLHFFSDCRQDNESRVPFDGSGDPRNADALVKSHVADLAPRSERHYAYMDDDAGGFAFRLNDLHRRRNHRGGSEDSSHAVGGVGKKRKKKKKAKDGDAAVSTSEAAKSDDDDDDDDDRRPHQRQAKPPPPWRR